MADKLRYFLVIIVWLFSGQVSNLTFAAGPRDSKSFRLATAIADVFNKEDSATRIDVFETNGSTENIRLIAEGQVDFAAVQADTPANTGVAAVAKLYLDAHRLTFFW